MAAALKKGPVFCVRHARCHFKPVTVAARLFSGEKWDGQSPPPWAPRQVPLGDTFKAIKLTKNQNKEYWHGLHKKLNKNWKKQLQEMQKRIEDRASQPKPDPPLLFMVIRVRRLVGRPYWEKDAVKELGLDPMHKPVVIENKESNHTLLNRIKHLIEILPIRFPYGLPETEEDYEHCVLQDNGEFIVVKKISPGSEETALVTKEDSTSVWDLKQSTIDRVNELKKMNYQLNAEYFPTTYTWTKNEDGKEYRYKGNINVGANMKWY